ncbi:alpha-2 adrenergic receptor [Trichonephila clavipes]|nr:alpha-2 adrenergic receptor [Trichonephila clavipes]
MRQPEERFIAKQKLLMKIGNNGNLVLGPFDESTPCLMIVLMNCQTKLRINHLTAVNSFAILERLNLKQYKKALTQAKSGAKMLMREGEKKWSSGLSFFDSIGLIPTQPEEPITRDVAATEVDAQDPGPRGNPNKLDLTRFVFDLQCQAIEELAESDFICRTDGPACLPNFNSIEHVRDAM